MRVAFGMALLWLFIPALPAMAETPYRSLLGKIVRTNCQSDVCTWFSIEASALAGTSRTGTLLRVTIKNWTSVHPDGSYDYVTKRKTIATSDEYFFCSKSKPAIIYTTPDRPGWFAYRLSPDRPGRTSTNLGLYARYWAACHGIAVAVGDDRGAYLAITLGYHTTPDGQAGEQPLDSPEAALAW